MLGRGGEGSNPWNIEDDGLYDPRAFFDRIHGDYNRDAKQENYCIELKAELRLLVKPREAGNLTPT